MNKNFIAQICGYSFLLSMFFNVALAAPPFHNYARAKYMAKEKNRKRKARLAKKRLDNFMTAKESRAEKKLRLKNQRKFLEVIELEDIDFFGQDQ